MIWLLSIALVLAFNYCDHVHASDAWGVTVGSHNSIGLHLIDQSTGAISTLSRTGGSLSVASVLDLASDPLRYPTLVWAVRDPLGVGNELIAVNPYREEIVSYALIDTPNPVQSIAINPQTGVMYGATVDALYTIDLFSGNSTLVGPTTVSVASGLGFDGAGRLYGVDISNRSSGSQGPNAQLQEINLADASLTPVTATTGNFAVDLAADPQDGVLYGLGVNGYVLSRIDPDDGTVTTIGNSLGRPGGLAFTFVPEPASLSLVGIALWSVWGTRRGLHRCDLCSSTPWRA